MACTFTSFLSPFRVCKGHEFTHTSIGKPISGSFYVPGSRLDSFYEEYIAALSRGDELCLTERHRHIGPIVIDLDFRYEGQLRRIYTEGVIAAVVTAYASVIQTYIECSEPFDCFVLEKQGPAVHKGIIKDGVHIIFPDIVTRPEVQLMIRQDVLPEIKRIFDTAMPELINPIDDVIDESVIERNNWMMYGSRKVGSDPYRLTKQFRIHRDDTIHPVLIEEMAPYSDARLVILFSIRNKYIESIISSEQRDRINEFIKKRELEATKRDMIMNILHSKDDPRLNVCQDIEQIQKLVAILSPTRVESYSDWIRLGWCLRNIDYRLLDTWIEFSKQSPKYVEGECPRLWNSMRSSGLGAGTLYMWARSDAPEKYRAIIRESLYALITQSISGCEYDVACVVFQMFKHEFVCSNIKTKKWYTFRSHRWQECDSAHLLRKHLSIEVSTEFLGVQRLISQRACAVMDEAEQKQLVLQTKKLAEIALKLKSTKFKDNVLRECAELFYVESFENKLNSNTQLLGFENGIFDLERLEFREGRPDDFVSFSTGINYIPHIPEHPCVQEIQRFWESVHPDPNIREYVLMTLSSCLSGAIRDEKFYIWTGSGSNGKSATVSLIEKTLGEYCCKFPVTLLTHKRAASGNATPEIARAKGRRFAVLQEPGEDERLNIGQLKELSGGDVVQTRELYQAPTEWRPQFKLFLLCNQLPQVPSDDGGTWRRIRVVEFSSKFTENPNPSNPKEFPMDMELHTRIEGWREHFASMLIEAYKRYILKPIIEPPTVTACTREYQRTNDHIADFIDSCIEHSIESKLTIDQAFTAFREWARAENVPLPKSLKRASLVKYIDRWLGRTRTMATEPVSRTIWNGIKLRTD